MSDGSAKIISVNFFRNEGGGEPVRDWLMSLDASDRKIIGFDIKQVEFGWPLGMPLVKAMANYSRLWEVRIDLPGNRIARVLFTVHRESMVLLHGFIKKSQKTPTTDLKLAESRKRIVQRGN